MLCHNCAKLLIASLLRIPTQLGLCLGRIAPQVHNIGRAIPLRVYANQHLAGLFIIAPGKQNHRFLKGLQSDRRRVNIGPLGIVVVPRPADFRHEFDPMLDALNARMPSRI